jgi:hypothetical protein
MNEKNSLNDFRTTRCRLPPDAFALGPKKPDPPPQDIIEEKIWKSIIFLPEDVSLRTSDNHGAELKAMYELWASWIESFGEDQDAMWHTMLDGGDEFQACLFNSLCGFYRVATSCLRTALELTTIGAYFQLLFGPSELLEWKEGKLKLSFGRACDHLLNHPKTRPLHDYLKTQTGYSMFGQKSPGKPEGWARKLYSELSGFAHSRPTHSSAIMWEGSNGPIYVPSSFGRVYALYLDTMALGYILIKIARPAFKLPQAARHLFQSSQVFPSKVAVYSYEFLWNKSCL